MYVCLQNLCLKLTFLILRYNYSVERKPRYDNKYLFKAWVSANLRTPKQVVEQVGISQEEAEEYALGVKLPTAEVMGRTLELTGKTYEEGANLFLDEWGHSLRKEEIREKIASKKRGDKNPMFGKAGKDSPTFRRKHTKEAKAKMSAARKLRVIKNSTKEKISAAQLRPGTTHPDRLAIITYIMLSEKTVNLPRIARRLGVSHYFIKNLKAGSGAFPKWFIDRVLEVFPPQNPQDREALRSLFLPSGK